MACSFKYKGAIYSTKAGLEAAVREDLNTGALKAPATTAKNLIKLTDNLSEIAVMQKAADMFGSDQFVTVIQDKVTGDKYITLDDRLIEENTSPVREFRTLDNKKVEINVEETYERWKEGGRINKNVRGLLTAMKVKLLDEVIDEQYEKATRPIMQETNEEIFDKLKTFAESLGISVISMEQYLENYKNRNGVPASAEALADMMEQVIALSNGQSVEQLSEEVAHFVVEYSEQQDLIDQMLENIDQTTAYKAESARYRQIYSKQASGEALERMVRKEILGKILAERMIKNFQGPAANEAEASVFQRLSDVFRQLLDLFRITDANSQFFSQFGEVLDDLVADVKQGRREGFNATQSRAVYFSASRQDQIIQDQLSAFLNQLDGAYRSLSRSTERIFTAEKKAKLQQIIEAIGHADYLKAIHASLLSMEQDMRKTNTAIRDARQKMDARDEAGYEKMLQYLGNVNVQNLSVFYENVGDFLTMLDNFLDTIDSEINNASEDSPLGQINRADVARMRRLSSQVRAAYSENLSDYKGIAKAKTALLTKEMLRSKSSQEEINEELTKSSNNVYDDISWFNAKVYSFYETAGHPALKLIAGLYLRAMERVKQQTDIVYADMVDLQTKLNLTRGQTSQLMKDGFMINPWKMRQYLKDEAAARKTIEDKYTKELVGLNVNDPQFLVKQTELLDKKRTELLEHDQRWKEMRFKPEFYEQLIQRKTGLNTVTRSNKRRPEAQNILSAYAASKNKILSKYYDKKTGSINYARITVADEAQLKQIYSDIKAQQSMYNTDGSLKSDLELAIALDIRDYFSVSNDTEISAEAQARFESARAEAERTLSKDDYNAWLETFSYQAYDISYDSTTFEVNEEDTEANLMSAGKLNDLRTLMTIDLVVEKEVNGRLVVEKLDETSSLQDIYDALRQQKQQLLKPYRSANIAGEIDGAAVDNNLILRERLDAIDSYLRYFEGDWAGRQGVEFERMGNKSFFQQLKNMEKVKSTDPRAYFNWLNENTMKGRTDVYGRPVPSKSYYAKFVPLEEGSLVEKVAKPKFLWEMRTEDEQYVNPNFNTELGSKGVVQPKLSSEMTSQYIDEDYFNMFGISKDNIYSKNVTRNQALFEARTYFLSLKEELDAKAGIRNAYYQLPQVRRYGREVSLTKSGAKAWFSRNFVIDNYDEDFGEKSKRVFGVNTKSIPRYFTRLLEDPKELTQDIGYMYMSYAQMAYNYDEKGQVVNDVTLLRDRVANAQTSQGGSLTNTLKKLDDWVDSFIYGNKNVDLGNIFGSKISTTKLLKALYRFVSNTNLAFNIFVPVVGQITSMSQRRILATTNKYFSQESLNWAIGNAARTTPQMFLESGKLKQKNIGDSLLQFAGVGQEYQKMKGIFTDRTTRSALRTQPGYLVYEVFTKNNGVIAVSAVYDSYRLYDDPATGSSRFINKQQFIEAKRAETPEITQSDINSEWSSMRSRSFYNYLSPTATTMEVQRDKMIQDGVRAEDIDMIVGIINRNAENAHNMIEGQTKPEERALLTKHPLGAFLYMHRGFLQRGIESRFRKSDYDYFTGTESEGSYTAVGRMFSKDAFKRGEGLKDAALMGSYFLTAGANADALNRNTELTEDQKGNLRKLGMEMYTMIGLFGLYVFMNLFAGDDDREEDWATQYMAYISTRAYMESISTSVFGVGEFLEILDSPTAGVNTVKTITGIPSFFFEAGEEVKKGPYEGLTKNQAKAIKLTPVKNIYSPLLSESPGKSIRGSNVFFRQNVIPTIPEYILQSLEGDK